MARLRTVLAKKIPVWREEIGGLVRDHGAEAIGDVTVRQAYGGMRGIKSMEAAKSQSLDPRQFDQIGFAREVLRVEQRAVSSGG